MRMRALLIGVSLGFAVGGSAGALDIDGRTCRADGAITVGQELCDPGSANVASNDANSFFELHAKKRSIPIDADPALGLPQSFDAYVFDFNASADSGSLAPPVFHVAKPAAGVSSHIRFHLFNELPHVDNNTFMVNAAVPAGDQPLNIHTHGLLVRPADSQGAGPYGDFVGVLGCGAEAQAICPADMEHLHATEICGLAKAVAAGKHCSGAGHVHPEGKAYAIHGHEVWLEPIPYDIEVPASHPASLNWFHPHAHEISSPQVAAGLAGVLTIGTLCSDYTLPDDYCSKPSNGEPTLRPDHLRERVLMLKDVQVFDHRQGDGPADSPKSAEGYRVIPTCNPDPGKAPPSESDKPDDIKKNRYQILDRGFCQFESQDVDLPGNWLFTINGQIQPTITMKQGVPELWRIANTSSNATYRLSLCKDQVNPDQSDLKVGDCENKQNFQIISLDGGQKSEGGPPRRNRSLVAAGRPRRNHPPAGPLRPSPTRSEGLRPSGSLSGGGAGECHGHGGRPEPHVFAAIRALRRNPIGEVRSFPGTLRLQTQA